MPKRLLLGVSILWLPLAFITDGVTTLVLPVVIQNATGGSTATLIGLISFAGLLAAVAAQPLFGWLGDAYRSKLDRRLVATVAAAIGVPGLLVLATSSVLLSIAAAYLVLQLSASGIQSAQQTLIPEHAPASWRGRASGLKVLFDVGGSFVAFLAIGALLSSAGAPAAALVIGLVMAVAFAAFWLWVPRAKARPSPAVRASGIPAGLVRLIAVRFLFLFGTYAVGRFLLLLLSSRMGIGVDESAGAAGALLALFALVSALAALPFGALADRTGGPAVMAAGILLSAAGIALLIPAAGVAGIIAGGLAMSLGTAAFVPANWAATTALVDPREAGRLMGLANLGTGGAVAAAGLLGPIIDALGFSLALGVAAAVTLLSLMPLLTTPESSPALHSEYEESPNA